MEGKAGGGVVEASELTLDPQDWEPLRALGHRMLDDVLDSLRDLRRQPAWRKPSADVRRRLEEKAPREPQGAERVYADFRELVFPYRTGNIHPRFWGWVMGTGTPFTVLAELLAAGMNPNVGGFDDGASLVEDRVYAWFREILDLPEGTTGLLVSGGSMANLVGLATARAARAGFDVRTNGVGAGPRLTVYASTEAHSSVKKALELMGMGSEALRLVPVDAEYRIDVAALSERIAADRAAGLRPIAVVGNAVTVNTGAIDDLGALAELCAREGLHFHVDGAIGALAWASPALRPLLEGMQHADSLAFDLHKWGYFPLEAGCVMVRDAAALREAFATSASYLATIEGGIAARTDRFAERGPQLSRGFRALKVWMGLKEQGFERHAALIEQNVAQAQRLAALVRETPALELLAPAPLNIVCFRYRGDGSAPDAVLDSLNARILVRLQEDGIAVPSSTVLKGRFALRVSNTNQRTRFEDFEALVREVLRLGKELG